MGLVRTPIHIHVWCMRDDGKLNLRERECEREREIQTLGCLMTLGSRFTKKKLRKLD